MEKYKEQITQAKKFFTFQRDPFKTWTLFKITILAAIMSASDFFLLLVQSKFINKTNVLCDTCSQPMNINKYDSSPDGLRYQCKRSRPNPKDPLNPLHCDCSKTVRTNSWFFNSKLSLPEVTLITHNWWYKVENINYTHLKIKIKTSTGISNNNEPRIWIHKSDFGRLA